MTATISEPASDLSVAVEAAARQLVSISHRQGESHIHIPIFYPSGAASTVIVSGGGDSFTVSDGGFAFREAALVGGEARFSSRARKLAERLGIESNSRMLFATSGRLQLAATIADIASASAQLAHSLVLKATERGAGEIAIHLYDRLVEVFGEQRVKAAAKLSGASTHRWEVSALVVHKGTEFVFDAVGNHHASVFSTSAKFRDFSLLSRPPVTTAVVHSKADLGSYYAILAQAGNVIEEGASNDDFRMLMLA